VVEGSGLESPCGKSQKTARNAENCGANDAQEALFTVGSAARDGTQTGTLSKPKRITRARLDAASKSLDEIPEDIFALWMNRGVAAYTYFARGLVTGRIKIGKSKHPWTRVSNLACSNNGEKAELICTLRGGHFERLYHSRFAEHHDGNEWFAPHPDIFAEIERLAHG
jgi:hypothetical protein